MDGSGETVLAFPAKFASITSRDPVRTWTPDGVFLYFSDVLIVPKVPLSLVPTPCTETIIAIAIPAAIKPYSIAVAPDFVFEKCQSKRLHGGSQCVFAA